MRKMNDKLFCNPLDNYRKMKRDDAKRKEEKSDNNQTKIGQETIKQTDGDNNNVVMTGDADQMNSEDTNQAQHPPHSTQAEVGRTFITEDLDDWAVVNELKIKKIEKPSALNRYKYQKRQVKKDSEKKK